MENEAVMIYSRMATTFQKSRDANMNCSLGGDTYTMYSMPGSPAGNKKMMTNYNPRDMKKHSVSNMTQYRDNSRRRDTTPPRDKNSFRPPFEDFDKPPSPDGGGYRDDRIQNDLLDEICSDIGIKDATDLDIFDFDSQTDQYIIGQTRLPEDLDCLDETISFSDFQPEQYRDFDVTSLDPSQKPPPSRAQYGQSKPLPPLCQRPVTDEQKCASQDVFNSVSSQECLASPTVSSTCPGSHPRPASQGSAVGSPALNSTNLHQPLLASQIGEDFKDIKQLKKELHHFKSGGSKDSPVPSPAMSCGSRGPPSVECLGRFGPPSVSNDRSDVSSTTPGPTEDNNSCMLSSSPDKKFITLKPSTPGTPGTPSKMPPKNHHKPSIDNCYMNMKPSFTHQRSSSPPPPHLRDQGYSSSVGTGSHYGSSHSLSTQANMDPLAKDKVMRFLDQSQPTASSQNTEAPSEPSSASSSPPQHVAKKARIINSGNDLLAEMRNRYAFVKGADMYVPNKHPNIDGSYAKPDAAKPQPPPSQNTGFQGQYSSTPKINFADTSCMNNNSNSCAQTPQFNSCSRNNGPSFTASGGNRVPNTSYYGNQQPQTGEGAQNLPQPPQTYNQVPDYNRSMSESSQYATHPPQNNMYGSCPNLGPQTGGAPHPGVQQLSHNGRPYSPNSNPGNRVPVAQPRMSVQGNQGYQNSGYGQQPQQQYQTPSTSPVPSAPQGAMYNNTYQRNSMNQSFSAPSTPMKQGQMNGPSCGESYQGQGQGQGQWSQQGQGYHVNQGQQNAYNRGPNAGPMQQNSQNMQMNPAMRGNTMHNQTARNQYPGNHGNQMGEQLGHPQGNVNMQMRPQSPAMGPYNPGVGGAPQPQGGQNCRMMGPGGGGGGIPTPDMMTPAAPQNPTHLPGVPTGPIDTQTPVSQHGFMQSIITDRSSAFRSHPLFPLLRDLIIADMNFHTPSFPFQLIANLPQDFDRLLQNYLHRNPPMPNYQGNEAVEGVIMDALKYAHRALIEKIQMRKEKEGYKETPKPISAIEDFCERFDRAVKNSMAQNEFEGVQDPFMNNMGQSHCSPGLPPHQPDSHSMGPPTGMMGPPTHMAPHHPHPHPTMNGMHSQSYTDLTHMKGMGPGPSPYQGHPHIPGFTDRRSNSLPSTPRKNGHGRLHDTASETNLNRTGSDKNVTAGSGTGTGKSKVLPKESVAVMMDWLRAHQDNPYPNDDEKEMLIQKTKLTINQINYWFTNARRRILPKWALQRYMEQQEKQKQLDSQQFGGTQPAAVGANH